MFKKLSVALVAMSLVAVAQPALAQSVTKTGKIEVMAVAQFPAKSIMRISGDQSWVFIEAPAQPATVIFIKGQNAKVKDLKVGMVCSYTGTNPKAYLSKVSCE